MQELACTALNIYTLILFARAILSFFPVSRDGPMATISSLLFRATEPVLAPLRRVIPRMGMFDLSFLVLILIIRVLQAAICTNASGF